MPMDLVVDDRNPGGPPSVEAPHGSVGPVDNSVPPPASAGSPLDHSHSTGTPGTSPATSQGFGGFEAQTLDPAAGRISCDSDQVSLSLNEHGTLKKYDSNERALLAA